MLNVLNVMLFEMRAERNSCARNITLDWIEVQHKKAKMNTDTCTNAHTV